MPTFLLISVNSKKTKQENHSGNFLEKRGQPVNLQPPFTSHHHTMMFCERDA